MRRESVSRESAPGVWLPWRSFTADSERLRGDDMNVIYALGSSTLCILVIYLLYRFGKTEDEA
jgi:hypothetical protein